MTTTVWLLVAAVLATVALVRAETDACKQHLSSCRACLADTANNCVVCRGGGLQQCIKADDPLATRCSALAAAFPGQAELLDTLDQCDAVRV